VSSRQDGLDPVGATVGQRGARVQAVVAELAGEKIDVIPWNDDPAVFVANALSPAQVLDVSIDEDHRIASVTVPERMLSLAIGREGQNARLAAKLTGWRIDIRSDVSVAEAKAAAAAEAAAPAEALAPDPVPVTDPAVAPAAGTVAVLAAPAKAKTTRAKKSVAEPTAPAEVARPATSDPAEPIADETPKPKTTRAKKTVAADPASAPLEATPSAPAKPKAVRKTKAATVGEVSS